MVYFLGAYSLPFLSPFPSCPSFLSFLRALTLLMTPLPRYSWPEYNKDLWRDEGASSESESSPSNFLHLVHHFFLLVPYHTDSKCSTRDGSGVYSINRIKYSFHQLFSPRLSACLTTSLVGSSRPANARGNQSLRSINAYEHKHCCDGTLGPKNYRLKQYSFYSHTINITTNTIFTRTFFNSDARVTSSTLN